MLIAESGIQFRELLGASCCGPNIESWGNSVYWYIRVKSKNLCSRISPCEPFRIKTTSEEGAEPLPNKTTLELRLLCIVQYSSPSLIMLPYSTRNCGRINFQERWQEGEASTLLVAAEKNYGLITEGDLCWGLYLDIYGYTRFRYL